MLLALASLCASVYCCGALALMSYNAGNTNDPDGYDRLGMMWAAGAVVFLLVSIGSVVAAWRSKSRAAAVPK